MTTTAPVLAQPSPAVTDPSRQTRLAVGAILVVALAARVALVLATRDLQLANDPADYHRLATNVAGGHGFGETVLAAGGGPTAFRSPLYPFALGLFYDVVGVSVTAARLAQAVLGVVTVALIGLLAARLFGRRAGLIAAAIAAVYPPLLLTGGSLLTESIAMPLLLGALLLALEHRRRGGLRLALATGAVTGLGILTRENYVVLLLPLALLAWNQRPRWSAKALVAPAVVVVTALGVVAPWTLRNAIVMDAFLPVSDATGYVWGGVYNEVSDAGDKYPAAFVPPSAVPAHRPLFADRSLDEDELARELQASAADYAREHPAYVAKVLFWNSFRMFDLGGTDFARVVGGSIGWSTRASDLAVLGWYAVAPFALAGAVLARRRVTPYAIWLVPVLFWATTVVALGTFRYRAPIEPFVLCLAALAVREAYDRIRDRAAVPASAPTTAPAPAVR